MGIEDIRDALVIRHGSSFLLSDPQGNVPAGNAQGLGIYHGDTRHLSVYDLTLNGAQPVVLLSTAELGYAMEQVLTNPTMESGGRTIARGSTEIRRLRVVADVVEETLRVTNFNAFPITLDLAFEFAADFADIFDVRGYERQRQGILQPPVVKAATIEYAYRGIDGVDRHTTLGFDPPPDEITETGARFRVALKRRESATLHVHVDVGDGVRELPPLDRFESVSRDHREWLAACTQVFSDNEFFNRVMARSLGDIRMLSSETKDGQRYIAAGTPWFDALFGRDSCIASMQLLAYRPEIARDTLRLLARWQGQAIDRSRDEEPGKILHELRTDELSRAGELPYGPYFGSIDSTPLFLMLIAEYYAWTADAALVRELLPAARAAADWLDTYGDIAGSGYLSYEKRSEKGLVNQGWKDSWDAVSHASGALARPPVALVEAQGYAFAARSRMASVLDQVGETELAARFRRDAARTASQFDGDFWCEDLRYFAIALDGERQPVRSIASNPAHCLWTGLIDPARALHVVAGLMSNEMFSGWGIRTLAAGSPRFNPIGYHLGTVWPHDNSIAAMGLKMYGFVDELNEVATALFDAAAAFPYFRLPELFGGQARSAQNTPVPYPVACRPQAWAAGAFPLITQAILGLKAEAPQRRLRVVAPALPNWLNWLQIRGLRVGDGAVSLLYRRDGEQTRVEVQETTAGLEVTMSDGWPL